VTHRLIIRNAVFTALLLGPLSAHPLTSSFRQGVNGYTGTVDTYVRMDQPTNRFESAAVVLVDNDPIAHGLIRFDNIFGSGPGQVPSNSYNILIESARLTLRTSNNGDPVWFHRMLVPWHETNNWNKLSSSGPGLQADNIEMSAVPDFTFTGSTPVPRVDAFDVTATVRGWLAGDFPNYGWGITNQSTDGWQFDSSENTNVNNRPLLEIFWISGDPPPRIIRQPLSSTNAEGSGVVLSVVVSGSSPSFQWFKDGVLLNDATNSSYAIIEVRRTDAGSYTVYISSPFGETNSNPAILTVIPDDTPPSLLCAYGTNNLLTIFVEFSEIVTNGTDLAYYAVSTSDGGEYLTVTSAVNAGGGTQDSRVVLTLDPAAPLVPGQSYLLNVGAISDRFGNVVDPAFVIPIALYSRTIFTISDTHLWKFNDAGNDLGAAWREVGYNDDLWPSGLPLLGFETAPLPQPLRTSLSRTNAAGLPINTYYFRTHFDSIVSGFGVFRFRTVLDDAAAIYLNGAEIFRLRLPAGPLDYMTGGAGGAVGDAAYEGPFTVCVSNLVMGDNVLAVEVHQTGFNSSDLVFGMELLAMSADPPPSCFGRQPTNQTINAGSPVTFVVEYRCPYSTAQWFKDGMPIPGATNLTYTIGFAWPSDEGAYNVVVDGTQSATAQLAVFSCCAPEVLAVYATNGVIVLQFDEETINGLDLANFIVSAVDNSHELFLESAAYSSGTNYGTVLLLRITPFTPMQLDTPYKIYFEGIEDRFGNATSPTTWPIARFPSSLIRLDASQQWRYDTSGTDLSNAWYRLDYDDTAWLIGLALFDAKRPPRTHVSGEMVRTMTTLSNATATAQLPTHYFRTRFNYAGPVSSIICIRPFVDDGAVYYLNGREVLRPGMPQFSPISYSTMATTNIGDATFGGPYYVTVTNLVSGENVLAVEVHQQSIVSSDLTFGTEFGLLLTVPPPRLRIAPSADATEIILTWNGSAKLEQTSSLSPGGWSQVKGASSGYRTPRAGTMFFRLREP
jgi:hypothetical protein